MVFVVAKQPPKKGKKTSLPQRWRDWREQSRAKKYEKTKSATEKKNIAEAAERAQFSAEKAKTEEMTREIGGMAKRAAKWKFFTDACKGKDPANVFADNYARVRDDPRFAQLGFEVRADLMQRKIPRLNESFYYAVLIVKVLKHPERPNLARVKKLVVETHMKAKEKGEQ